ncbi:MAG: hypothetical protein WBM44_07735 [Waterburya sp.]
MPTFPIGKNCSPPEVAGVVWCIKISISHHMGSRINEPGAVPEQDLLLTYLVFSTLFILKYMPGIRGICKRIGHNWTH